MHTCCMLIIRESSVPKNCLKGISGSLLGLCERDYAAMTLTHQEVCVLNPQVPFFLNVNTAVAFSVVQRSFFLTAEDFYHGI